MSLDIRSFVKFYIKKHTGKKFKVRNKIYVCVVQILICITESDILNLSTRNIFNHISYINIYICMDCIYNECYYIFDTS